MDHRLTFPPRAGVVRKLRAAVRELATKLGAGPSVADSLALVVDELVNNAVEHGAAYRHRNLDLSLQVGTVAGRYSIEFFDPEMPADTILELNKSLMATLAGMPSLESERGRGLFLLSVYLENLRVEVAPAGGLRLVGLVAQK